LGWSRDARNAARWDPQRRERSAYERIAIYCANCSSGWIWLG
jgi:hypothetical protein